MKLGPKPKPEADRFWPKVQRGEPLVCWPWTGGTKEKGYGVFRNAEQRAEIAHRAAWRLTHGPIPEGLCALHRCDTPSCCNPTHLFLGTHQDNCDDKYAKGRQRHLRGEQHPRARLTEAQVRAALARRASGETIRAIAADLGVRKKYFSRIANGKGWMHLRR